MELFVEYAAFIILAVLVLGAIGYLGLPRNDSTAPAGATVSDAPGSAGSSGVKPNPPS
ncbi:MAG TPA: hypothetical protein VKB87_25630 [Myxococcaceae bacterium]|nr:hypothetical protein [Myxococcaceae bacterium]